MNQRENGPDKNRKQTVLSSSFKTLVFSVHFLQRRNTILPCTYHVAELEPVSTKYHSKYRTSGLVTISTSSKQIYFIYFLMGWPVEEAGN